MRDVIVPSFDDSSTDRIVQAVAVCMLRVTYSSPVRRLSAQVGTRNNHDRPVTYRIRPQHCWSDDIEKGDPGMSYLDDGGLESGKPSKPR